MPYGSHASEDRLHWLAIERISDERLPVICPGIIRPWRGSDGMCQLCGLLIDRYRIEYQVTDPRDGYELAFHLMCYRVWQLECRQLLAKAYPSTFHSPVIRRSSTRPQVRKLTDTVPHSPSPAPDPPALCLIPNHPLIGHTDPLRCQITHMSRRLDGPGDVTRVTRGQFVLHKRPICLDEVVEAATDAARSLIERKGQHLLVELPGTEIKLNADAARLTQVVSNLLLNAAKYTGQGGQIRLTAREQGAFLYLSVKDNGVGISPEHIPSLFMLFLQPGARNGADDGLGIGLGLSKNIIDLHGGTVEARSAGPGAGSEFEVRLPLLASDPSWPQ